MKKFLLSALIMGGMVSANAQGSWVEDSLVLGNQYKNRIFYSLKNGAVGSTFEHFDKVDFIAVSATAYSSALRINGGFSAQLYHYAAGDTADWATLDTTGLASSTGWTRVRDDHKDLLGTSAFEVPAAGMGGWGEYNMVSHVVEGTELFVYRKGNVWKKVWILNKTAGTFNIKLADLNGANETTFSIPALTPGKNFVYYSISEDSVYNVEPNSDSYDLVFGKLEAAGSYGPIPMAENGVSNNFTITTSGQNIIGNYVESYKVGSTDPEDAVYDDASLNDEFGTIGGSWKALNMATFQYAVLDSVSYFIKDLEGSIWQLAFTEFHTGSGVNIAKYKFKKRLISAVSIEENNETIGAWNVFPNPTTDYVSVVFNSNVADMANFSLVDLNGRQVMTQNFSANLGVNQYTVDIAGRNLPTGIYVATLRAGNVVKTTKLIIQ